MYSTLLIAYMSICRPLLGQFLPFRKDFENEHKYTVWQPKNKIHTDSLSWLVIYHC